MNVYFLNLKVPSQLIQTLGTQAFTVCRTSPKRRDRDALLALVFINTASSLNGLKKIAALKKRLPDAWIVIVTPQAHLMSAVGISRIAGCQAKNDTCSAEHWPRRFWFILQMAIAHQRLTRQIATLTEERVILHRQMQTISDKAQRLIDQLEANLEMAENVQRCILPKYTPEIPGIPIAVKYLPAAGIGGDYYDIFEFGDKRRFGFLLADSQTHGMAAALLGVLLKVRLEEMKDRFPDTKTFVDFIGRELFMNYGGSSSGLTRLNLFYGILDRASLTFEFTVAGALQPILVRHAKLEPVLVTRNPALGGVDHHRHQDNRLKLKPGDLLVLHTDGLYQSLDHAALTALLQDHFARHHAPDSLSVQNEILGQLRAKQENRPLPDDITLISLSVVENTLYLANYSK